MYNILMNAQYTTNILHIFSIAHNDTNKLMTT